MPRIAVLPGTNAQRAGQHAGEDGEAAEQRRRLARQAALLQAVHRADAAGEPRDHRRVSAVATTKATRKPRKALSFMPAAEDRRRNGARPAAKPPVSRRDTRSGRPSGFGTPAGGQVRRDRRSGFLDMPISDDRPPHRPGPARRRLPRARRPARSRPRPRRGAIPARWPAPSSSRSRSRRRSPTAGLAADRDRSPRRRHAAGQDLDRRGRRRRRRRRRMSGAGRRRPSPRARRGRGPRASGPRGASRPGDPIAPGRTVLDRLGGGSRYEVFLVWDEHHLAVLVAKVLRPDQAMRAGLAARARAARPARCPRSRIP